jgi:predicted amidohydrolase
MVDAVKIRMAIGQIKPTKGDYEANLQRVGDIFSQLEEEAPETDVLVLPETVLSGYFLEGGVREAARERAAVFEDLLRVYRERVDRDDAALDICAGFYEVDSGKYHNSGLYATLVKSEPDGRGQAEMGPPVAMAARSPEAGSGVKHVHRKYFLPTYGVFDEKRFVARGRSIQAFETRFGRAAILICEDVWHSITATIAALQGAQVIYVLSASPGREFGGRNLGNVARYNVLLPGIAEEHNVWVVYAGLVGFEGGKGFTGTSRIVDPWGNTVVQAPVTDECIVRATIDLEDVATARATSPLLSDLESNLADVATQLSNISARGVWSE